MSPRLPLALAGLAALALAIACGGGEEEEPRPQAPRGPDLDPPTARHDMAQAVRFAVEATPHPADGGGSARLLPGTAASVRVLSNATFHVEYTVGPRGVAVGGFIQFQPETSFDWSPPQTIAPRMLGYTTYRTDADGVTLTQAPFPGAVRLVVGGRDLVEGERVTLVYGDGPGVMTDPFVDRAARFWLRVDGDGDGLGSFVPSSPSVELTAADPTRLVATCTSTAQVGGTVRLHLAVLDELANRGVTTWGRFVFPNRQGFGDLPESVPLAPEDGGVLVLETTATTVGVHRLPVRYESETGSLATVANPLWVDPQAPNVLWGDLHGHSGLSDGTGTPEDYFAYAREVAGLDVVALTDHDHWGTLHVATNPELWRTILDATKDANQPGRFVALAGLEWTSWVHGHRHVLWFRDEPQVTGWVEHPTPPDLWRALRGKPALTLAHHSAGGPIATNWSFPPDPELEPLTEICSTHGSSEAFDAPRRVMQGVEGNYVRDQLLRGYRLGFIGSGDSHDGHPGLTHLSPRSGWGPLTTGERAGRGGLAAILAEEPTRPAVLEALRARRTWATSGPRILMIAAVAGQPGGATVPAQEDATLELVAHGTTSIAGIELIRNGDVRPLDIGGARLGVDADLELAPLESGDVLYLRLRQTDGAFAYAGPWFVE